nr:hypothetical protein [Dehalococcoidia bacterium]
SMATNRNLLDLDLLSESAKSVVLPIELTERADLLVRDKLPDSAFVTAIKPIYRVEGLTFNRHDFV